MHTGGRACLLGKSAQREGTGHSNTRLEQGTWLPRDLEPLPCLGSWSVVLSGGLLPFSLCLPQVLPVAGGLGPEFSRSPLGAAGRPQWGPGQHTCLCPLVLQPPEASGPEFSDAHMTWLNFVRRPDDGVSKKRCRSRDKKSVSPGSQPRAGVAVALAGILMSSCLPSEASLAPQGPLAPLVPQDPPVQKSPRRPCFVSFRRC